MSSSSQFNSFDEVFVKLPDFKLADCLACAVEERYGYETIMAWSSEVPLPHRLVEFVWSTTGYAECEGYVAFMWLDCDHEALAISLRELGLGDLATLVDKMIAPVQGKAVLGNLEALEAFFGDWERFAEWVSQFETFLFAASDRIRSAVALYCRNNKEAFRDLMPEIANTNAYKEGILGERN